MTLSSHRLFIVIVAFSAIAASQSQPPADPYKPVLDRLQAVTTLPLTKWRAINAEMPHGELPYGEIPFEPTGGGEWLEFFWHSAYRQDLPLPVWLYTSVDVPPSITGFAVAGSRIALDLGIGTNTGIMITVFVNHNMVSRGDQDSQVPIMLTQSAVPGQKLLIAVRILSSGLVGCCGGPPQVKLDKAQLLFTPSDDRPDPTILRQEIMTAELLIAAYPDGKAERQQQLDAAVKAIDLTALDKGDQAAFDASLKAAQAKLDVLRPYMKQFTVKAVGNSHIDMAWLWPETETVEVVRNTFGTALQLMREYPDFKFAASAAQAYVWMEEKYPAIFSEIEQRVKEGRWEIVGGMWVEPDLNMPDGESLVRQILYGKRYFQQKFGVNINIGWNPDSFGYNWQLPQIYKRSGIDYFVTQKLLWASEFTKFPYRLFWWQAPDGSRLLTYFPSDYANQIDPQKMARDSATYGPMMWKYNSGTNSAPAGALDMMYLYGVGDHGGGPTRVDFDTALRWQKGDLVYPQLNFSTAAQYFADLEKNKNELKIPTWDGELYFQYHRGVQTSQSEEKRGNRQNEVLVLNAEKLASIETLFGATYPQQNFDTAWKDILFNQFHDILPGSGIHINYVDAARKYAVASRIDRDIIQTGLNDIASRVVSNGMGVLVFNPLSWMRTGEVEFEVQFPTGAKDVGAIGPDGKPMPIEVLSNDWQTGRLRVRLLATNIPAIGYKLVRLVPQANPPSAKPFLTATADSLENEFIRLKVDPKTGCITSLS